MDSTNLHELLNVGGMILQPALRLCLSSNYCPRKFVSKLHVLSRCKSYILINEISKAKYQNTTFLKKLSREEYLVSLQRKTKGT